MPNYDPAAELLAYLGQAAQAARSAFYTPILGLPRLREVLAAAWSADYGGSITAAQFLQRFIKDDTPWAHLDIAGTGMAAPKTDVNRSWGSGFGVRLLNRLISETVEK